MKRSAQLTGALAGLGAAVLFGVSAPLSKLLLPAAGPLMLAALLYLGGGSAVALYAAVSRGRSAEAGLRRSDVPWLLGIVVTGGILGPVLMLTGLSRLSGVTGALLLNLEGPFTILLAVVLFKEHLGARPAVAALLIFAGAVLLGLRPGALRADPVGVAAIAAACLCWAVDNNFTQRLSLKDPTAVVRIKALGAGACMLALGLVLRHPLPPLREVGFALLLGGASYGLSILLDMYALRLLGAAREALYFATAPFIGALAAIPLLGEGLRGWDWAAGALMALGVGVLVRERHGHRHTHDPLGHDHLHVHDAHHQHGHDGPVQEPHSHPHHHAALTHDHPHVSDAHHRHRHG